MCPLTLFGATGDLFYGIVRTRCFSYPAKSATLPIFFHAWFALIEKKKIRRESIRSTVPNPFSLFEFNVFEFDNFALLFRGYWFFVWIGFWNECSRRTFLNFYDWENLLPRLFYISYLYFAPRFITSTFYVTSTSAIFRSVTNNTSQKIFSIFIPSTLVQSGTKKIDNSLSLTYISFNNYVGGFILTNSSRLQNWRHDKLFSPVSPHELCGNYLAQQIFGWRLNSDIGIKVGITGVAMSHDPSSSRPSTSSTPELLFLI